MQGESALVQYNDRIVTRFLLATVAWGFIGLLAGLYAAFELMHGWGAGRFAVLGFGRLLPVHSHLMLLAFGGNCFFAGSWYVLQRLCQVRTWSDRLAVFHFWGWQLMLLFGLVSISLGYSQGRPLAEAEWPLDVCCAGLWLLFMLNFFVTLHQRRNRYLYISLWFLIATLVAVMLLQFLQLIVVPVSLLKSYPYFAGLPDAFLQAWYARLLPMFLITLPFLGLMYYFVPKSSQNPVYSYRLAVLQFWSLLALVVWTGTQPLYFTAVPEWLQSLGLVAGLMLLAPQWGAVINGLFTLRRGDAIQAFFGLALISYGLVAFQETLVCFKSIQLLVQHTDWMIAQTHLLAMGWLASFVFAVGYYLVPKLWGQPLRYPALVRVHLWTHALSVLIFVGALSIAGLMQGFKWFAMQEDGSLALPQFLTTLSFLKPFYGARMAGGLLFLFGSLLAAVNLCLTARSGFLQEEAISTIDEPTLTPGNIWEKLEHSTLRIVLATLIALLIGALTEILPVLLTKYEPPAHATVKSYTPLEWYGRDLYVREGCASCHTQIVRLAMKEELRYGPSLQPWEMFFERPALWGRKRSGPDLQKIGGKYPDSWHFQHLIEPRSTLPESPMPGYPWLARSRVDYSVLPKRSLVMQRFGMNAGVDPEGSYRVQAKDIQTRLASAGIVVDADVEMLALIGYLQRLGTTDKL